MDPKHRRLLGEKDHLQLRQQVKAYLPFFFFGLLPFFMHVSIIIMITYKYFYNFNMLEKRWIFIENANSDSELLTLVLCSSLI